ncbi:MAG: DUF4230 domain-containing protein [Ginsengibacter sp.]
MRRLKKYLLIIVSFLLVIFLLQKIHWLPSFSNLFKSKPLIIDDTPVLVKEIHNLSQLITISMYDEVVIASSKPKHLPSFPGLRPVPDKIVIIGKGRVLAGVDLTKMKKINVEVLKDSISIYLPPAQIFSTIVNPSDFETFDEVGKWSYDEITEIKKKIRIKITTRALQNQILSKAYQRCKLILENFLRSLGYKKIYFQRSG